MRINVYSQELTTEVFVVAKPNGSGMEPFYGIRFMQHSSPMLHNTPEDDDRSAVTFWVAGDGRTMDRKRFARVLERAANLLSSDHVWKELTTLTDGDATEISEVSWPVSYVKSEQ